MTVTPPSKKKSGCLKVLGILVGLFAALIAYGIYQSGRMQEKERTEKAAVETAERQRLEKRAEEAADRFPEVKARVLADLTHAVEARDEGAFSLIENEYRKVSDAEFRAALLNATERLTAAREQRRAAQLAEERAQEEAKRAAKLEEGKRVTEEQEKEFDRPAEAYAANKIKEGGESDWHPSIPRFASVEAMMEEFGDYNKEEGTFAILSKKPLHIRVSRQVLPGDRADAVKGLNEMSLLFGVLRSFIHTPVEEITVTAYPIEYPKWPDTKNAKPLKEMALTLHAKRSDVFALISQIRPIKRFDDLLSVENGVYQPNKIYDAIYCDESSSHKPGRERFLRALAELPGAQVGTTTRKVKR